MFKFLISLAVALAIGGVAYGAAASLLIDNNPVLQYGEDLDLQCDNDGVQVYFTTSGGIDPTIDSVTVGGINSACNGHSMRIVLTAGGSWAAEYNPVAITGGAASTGLIAGPTAESITDIHLTIY